MNYFKRFCDFCAGFAAFSGIIYLLRKFMVYKFEEDENIIEKFKIFFGGDESLNRTYLIMIALFAASVIIGLIFEKLPYISFTASLLPFLHTVVMVEEKNIDKEPSFFLILAILHLAGNILHSINLDRADGKRRAFLCANICGVSVLGIALIVKKAVSEIPLLDEMEIRNKGAFFHEVFVNIDDGVDKLIMKIAIITLVTVALSFILWDIYFIDAALSAVPLGYTLYLVFTEKLTSLELLLFIITFTYFVFKLILVFFEPMAKKKKC